MVVIVAWPSLSSEWAPITRLKCAVDNHTAQLEIVDDGVGFNPFENPLGSDEMGRLRSAVDSACTPNSSAGRLNIRSRHGTGTWSQQRFRCLRSSSEGSRPDEGPHRSFSLWRNPAPAQRPSGVVFVVIA
jgi:hypothetical protein